MTGPRALSLHRPWAWLIMHAGKDIENRTWNTPYRGPVILHSAQSVNTAIAAELARRLGRQAAREAASTGFIGIVDLCAIHPASSCGGQCSAWAESSGMHWVLANPRPFPAPVPGPGSRGLFIPPAHVLAQYAQAIPQAPQQRRGGTRP